jgi:hypothetical protein
MRVSWGSATARAYRVSAGLRTGEVILKQRALYVGNVFYRFISMLSLLKEEKWNIL